MASIPFVLGGYAIMPVLLHAESRRIVISARWYLLIAPIWALMGMFLHPLRGIGSFTQWNGLRMLVPLMTFTTLGVAWLVSCETASFVAASSLIGTGILLIPCYLVARYQIPGPWMPQRSMITPMLRYGVPCVMTGLPQILNLKLDQILMAAFLPPRDLGLYVVAVAWSGAVSPLLTSIGTTLLPAVAAATDLDLGVKRVGEAVRMTAILATLMCVIIGCAAPLAIPLLFGAQFRGSVLPALILVPAAGILGINFSMQEAIRGLGFPYVVLRAELIGFIVTVISLTATLNRFGIVGAALSSMLGYAAVMCYLLANATRIAAVSMSSLIIPKRSEIKLGVTRLCQGLRATIAHQ
jgi:O-antigen/teichoic acid export membrane protein